jgi:hypothetical protein
MLVAVPVHAVAIRHDGFHVQLLARQLFVDAIQLNLPTTGTRVSVLYLLLDSNPLCFFGLSLVLFQKDDYNKYIGTSSKLTLAFYTASTVHTCFFFALSFFACATCSSMCS